MAGYAISCQHLKGLAERSKLANYVTYQHWRGTGETPPARLLLQEARGPFRANFTQSGLWGRLTADKGVLRAADGSTMSVPVTGPLEGTALKGDGWSVTVNSGWVLRPAARPGSYTIVREK